MQNHYQLQTIGRRGSLRNQCRRRASDGERESN